ncbi:hypothetical protein CLOSTMETH_00722 [[Clostridium] methylpentosum DSM 5476]|uniref:Uncharacterized protein n=1 Tax=[Clostridium] methylpentosum DSM 5476 TaxID=537013 RepID=C0EA68_9FIRM|nr:hypothetical protein CLOSTMETH_00722 [[Clostridium] methylpentosum DSM 5476]
MEAICSHAAGAWEHFFSCWTLLWNAVTHLTLSAKQRAELRRRKNRVGT